MVVSGDDAVLVGLVRVDVVAPLRLFWCSGRLFWKVEKFELKTKIPQKGSAPLNSNKNDLQGNHGCSYIYV